MSKQKLDLVQLATGNMAEPRDRDALGWALFLAVVLTSETDTFGPSPVRMSRNSPCAVSVDLDVDRNE